MSFQYGPKTWQKILCASAMLTAAFVVLFAFLQWELYQCGDWHAKYCRDRNYVDALVYIGGFVGLFATCAVATKLLLLGHKMPPAES
jgi:hypothetical protein